MSLDSPVAQSSMGSHENILANIKSIFHKMLWDAESIHDLILNKSTYGHHAWNFLHAISSCYHPNQKVVDKFKRMWPLFLSFLTCTSCKTLDTRIETIVNLTSRETVEDSFIQLHNETNRKIGQKELSYQEARSVHWCKGKEETTWLIQEDVFHRHMWYFLFVLSLYRKTTSKTHNEFVEFLNIWLSVYLFKCKELGVEQKTIEEIRESFKSVRMKDILLKDVWYRLAFFVSICQRTCSFLDKTKALHFSSTQDIEQLLLTLIK